MFFITRNINCICWNNRFLISHQVIFLPFWYIEKASELSTWYQRLSRVVFFAFALLNGFSKSVHSSLWYITPAKTLCFRKITVLKGKNWYLFILDNIQVPCKSQDIKVRQFYHRNIIYLEYLPLFLAKSYSNQQFKGLIQHINNDIFSKEE